MSRHEFKCLCTRELGYRPHKFEIAHLLDNDDDRISYEKAAAFLSKEHEKEQQGNQAKAIFDAMDVECRGFLTLSSVQQVFGQVSPSIKKEVVAKAFEELDAGKTGALSYGQFSWMFINTHIK